MKLRKIHRPLALLCMILLLALCGCSGGGLPGPAPSIGSSSGPQQPESGGSRFEPETIRVAMNSGDSFNPYRLATRLNRDISALLYDPLVRLSPSFQPENYLAEEITMQEAACTVRIRSGVRFSSGAALTAQDAAYSLAQCIAADTAGRYRNVLSYSAADPRTLVIQLARPDKYFASLLTFPIIPENSVDDPAPPGTGRFRMDGANRLIRNDQHFNSPQKVKAVELVPMDNRSDVGYQLLAGELDYTRLERSNSRVESIGSFPIQSNRMVFVGFNGAQYPCDQTAFRQAVSLLIDREALVRSAYGGRAVAAADPINPALTGHEELPPAGVEQANALLDSLGLDSLSDNGYRMRGGWEMELTLAINVESNEKRELAAILCSQLEKGKLKVTVSEYTYEKYQSQIATGGYTMFLGETQLSEDMDLTAFLSPDGALRFLMPVTDGLYQTYLSARQGQIEESAFFDAFAELEPFAPLVFSQDIIAHSRNFYSSVVATDKDIFYNIDQW